MSGANQDGERGDAGRDKAAPLVYRTRGGATDYLRAACAYLGANDGSGGSQPWTVKGWPITRERQTSILREWAVVNGLWISFEELVKLNEAAVLSDKRRF